MIATFTDDTGILVIGKDEKEVNKNLQDVLDQIIT